MMRMGVILTKTSGQTAAETESLRHMRTNIEYNPAFAISPYFDIGNLAGGEINLAILVGHAIDLRYTTTKHVKNFNYTISL